MSEAGDTPADRIEALRRSLPPKEGRRSRLGYPSKDDLAEMLGASRGRMIAWTTGEGYPEPRYRIKLAELSKGRYSPEDFAPPSPAALRALAVRQEELEAEVARMGPILEALVDRVEALESQASREARRGTPR